MLGFCCSGDVYVSGVHSDSISELVLEVGMVTMAVVTVVVLLALCPDEQVVIALRLEREARLLLMGGRRI